MKIEKYGEVPSSPVVMAACDSAYFIKYAPAFVYSASQHNKDVHIHVINPTDQVLALACAINSVVDTKVTYTFQDEDLTKLSEKYKQSEATNRFELRALYACLRFMVLPFLLPHAQKILVLDIDCLIMNDFEFPKEPVGYFPREPLPGTVGWENEGSKVAAGAVYFDLQALNIASAIANTLEGLPLQWFNDQIALNHVLKQIPDELKFEFDSSFMDWHFVEGTTIWTGKGPRKVSDPVYVPKQLALHDEIMDKIKSKDNVILKPRLDIQFKKGIVKSYGMQEPIRKYWQKFAEKYQSNGYHVVESPRWMFNKELEKLFTSAKQILVPHVEQHNYQGDYRTHYYMQTVFPWLFTVDPLGWAGGASYIGSFDPTAEYTDDAYYMMKEKLGEGKFGHLQSKKTPWHLIEKDNYIVVPLQLPHDETIKYHSDFSVEHFVTQLCHMANTWDGPQIVFKGHPVNFSAMSPLKDIVEGGFNNVLYVADANFNELVSNAQAMFVLNGGSGQEAMLHGIPVVCFGGCDYAPAVIQGDIDDPEKAFETMMYDDHVERIEMYKRWYDWYVNKVVIDINKT